MATHVLRPSGHKVILILAAMTCVWVPSWSQDSFLVKTDTPVVAESEHIVTDWESSSLDGDYAYEVIAIDSSLDADPTWVAADENSNESW